MNNNKLSSNRLLMILFIVGMMALVGVFIFLSISRTPPKLPSKADKDSPPALAQGAPSAPSKAYKPEKEYSKKLETVNNNLQKLKQDLREMIKKSTKDGEKSVNVYDNIPSLDVNGVITRTSTALSPQHQLLFTMDGADMKEPIYKMYSSDPELFRLLGEAGFLNMIGCFVGLATWAKNDRQKNHNSFRFFVKRMNGANMSDVNFWKNIEKIYSDLLTG